MEKVRVVIVGIGAIGQLLTKELLNKQGFEIVGAVDIDPKKVGRDLGEVLGLGKKLGVSVSNDIDSVLKNSRPHVVIHMTSSYLKDVYPQLLTILKHGVNVVSSCEELSYPYIVDRKIAEELDNTAKRYGSTLLATGINPGFLMDTLAIILTAPCIKVDSIKVTRHMNASVRRGPFQRKIGAGLTVDEFKRKISTKEISGHVGLEQSISLIAAALKVKLDKIDVGEVQPIISDKYVKTDYVEVNPGCVAGLRQTAQGIVNGKPFITLDFIAYVGATEDYDAIDIQGIPEIHERISPCVHGDWGTISMLINVIPKVMKAPPGLLTMKDITIPHCILSDVRDHL
jgi:4-hydroxy-tetrahydrodipicolinate reductase